MAGTLENNVANQSISKLYLKSNLADIHFEFRNDGETVPAHKTILAAATPVFEAMFFGPMKEIGDTIEIVDASASAFKEFLQIFYLTVVTITMEYMEEVVRLADKYDIIDRLNTCLSIQEGKVTTNNLIWVYQLASLLNNRQLKLVCEVQLKTFTKEVFDSEVFLHCDKSVIEYILKSEALNCTEFELFNACMKWTKSLCAARKLCENDPTNLRNQFGNLFQLIRFETMTNDELAMIMSSEPDRKMFSYNELANIVCMKSEVICQSEALGFMPRSTREKMWNNKAVLKFDIGGRGNRIILHAKKSTWFSVNVPILLGQIWWVNVDLYLENELSSNVSVVSIVEYPHQTFPLVDTPKIRCKASVELDDICLLLKQPILVHPGKMYEICFETVMNEQTLSCQAVIPKPLQEATEGEFCIRFHESPECKKRGGGLTSSLGFNKI